MPAPSPRSADDLESVPSSQPQPSPSNTTSESQAPPSHTINESQRSNILDAKLDLEKELRKTLLGLCFAAALQIATRSKQVAESDIDNSISLLSLGTAAIFAALFTSHFIGEKMPTASRVLGKVAFFLAATTFFFSIATPCPLSIKCAIWALYIISLIAIATCNFLLYSGGALTHAPQVPVVEGDAVEAVKGGRRRLGEQEEGTGLLGSWPLRSSRRMYLRIQRIVLMIKTCALNMLF
ncbi:hypothetical protein OIU74_005685 [Salix koriyanagi]|uniref:Uncharacterized protein n=1 Tax=Salix koriyanagi TaxID=2511006 RepID=A0A9Q0UPS2_9ROSI|nr:hypothetical protein OIU74_005685 [Salix koriyanagi]